MPPEDNELFNDEFMNDMLLNSDLYGLEKLNDEIEDIYNKKDKKWKS